jgi:hypothetical protein
MNNDNKFFSINVNDIQHRQNNKDRYRLQVYKRLLERCYIKIKSASDNEQKYCLYKVDEFVFGEPIYKLPECILFIITNLKNSGFLIKYYKPNVIYITWKIKRNFNVVVTNQNLLTNSNSISNNTLLSSSKTQIKDSDISICDIKNKKNKNNNKFKLVHDYVPRKNFLYNN